MHHDTKGIFCVHKPGFLMPGKAVYDVPPTIVFKEYTFLFSIYSGEDIYDNHSVSHNQNH